MTRTRDALDIFKRALLLEAPEHVAFFDRECAGDVELRAQVDALLRADGDAGDFLAMPIAARLDRSGDQVGAYRLQHLVGSGGMGSVYRAERSDGVYSRPVAIKLLLFEAGDLRQRFAREQRILGALDHPNIARLLDVGSDANGAPFLVMEFVEGQLLTDYMRNRALDARERVELFLKILDAVQTAHSQLVIHRDIKPGNVLVDAYGEPKLLDFGIAKLSGDQAPSMTRTGLGPLTPDYASPEQVRGEPIGIGSDIYSLGVLLYELLTGQRPYHIADDTRPSEIERIVCMTEPARPSTHLPGKGLPGSRRDLDAILLKALEKNARQRYASCAAFADDLRHWLDGQQVLAREPSWPERSLRFVRRHQAAMAIVGAAALALMVGSVLALWQAHVAGLERDRAEHVNRFLTDMLSAANPSDLGRKATLRDVLDRAQRLAERDAIDNPQSGATTLLTLASTYHALGESDAARHSAEAALAAANRSGDAAQISAVQIKLGDILTERGDFDASANILAQARALTLDRSNSRQRAQAAIALGSLDSRRDNPESARQWFETALRELPANDVATRGELLNNLAIVKDMQGDTAGALAMHRQVVDLFRKAYPHGHPDLAKALANLAGALESANAFEQAAAAYAEALPMQIELLGDSHPDVVQTLSSMANLSLRRGDIESALRDGARAWKAAQNLVPDHPLTAYAAVMYAQALCAARRASEALPLIEQALAQRKKQLPPDHPLIANTESLLGLATAQAGDVAAGERIARDAYERLRGKLGEPHELTVKAKQRLEQIQATP
ncbi:MAG: serine/threonine-protein kinase [Dokdonella sp.]